MMLTNAEFLPKLQSAKRSLFRLELQPAYNEPGERHLIESFLNGSPEDPRQTDYMLDWLTQVHRWVTAGVDVERVRVHDEPASDYQRWERWLGRWNCEAGENIRYMTRTHAFETGLLPAAGNIDWWLIDAKYLLTMHFDGEHRRVRNEISEDPTAVAQAREWRDLAVHHSRPD